METRLDFTLKNSTLKCSAILNEDKFDNGTVWYSVSILVNVEEVDQGLSKVSTGLGMSGMCVYSYRGNNLSAAPLIYKAFLEGIKEGKYDAVRKIEKLIIGDNVT